GIALLFAGLFFDNGAPASALQSPTASATPDRLAEPTLPASPTQADLGAQVYWLSCLPCHGDKGQGLTDEFRAAYPPEDRNCWESGCHGKNPYESGFTLPKSIPPVVGPDALARFADGAQLESYIRAAMPYWKPGSLTDEEAWKVTAFVLRANGLWDGTTELGPDNASRVKIQRGTASPAPTVEGSVSRPVPRRTAALVLVLSLIALALLLFLRPRKR
ncbi:MAG: c-type cytochrome, partial [Chloroflexota bacterium]